jgi:hypothetical protein
MLWSPQKSWHVQQVVSKHSDYLLQHYGVLHHKKFDQRYGSDEAGIAEAVVFSWLHSIDLSPEYKEDLGQGGPDFICHPKKMPEFIIEATTLESEALANRTGWSNDLKHGGGSFSLPTRKLQQTVSKKLRQLSKYSMPRLMAIVSCHFGAHAFFSDEGVSTRMANSHFSLVRFECLGTSDAAWVISLRCRTQTISSQF